MSERYPMRMRRRIIELYERGESTATIADMLGASVAGVRRVRQHARERGTIRPLHGGGRRPISAEDEAMLRQLMAERPDALVRELRDELEQRTGTSVCRQTVGRWLEAVGLSRKKSRPVPPSRIAPTSPRPVTTGSMS